MWKKKLEVITFYIRIDLILITMENIPPKLIYKLVQSMVPLLWSYISLFKLSHHDYVVVHHLCKHIKGLVMEIQTLSIWLWNFGLWSRCSPHDLINSLCRFEGWVSQNHCQYHHVFHYSLTLMLPFIHLFIKFACILSSWKRYFVLLVKFEMTHLMVLVNIENDVYFFTCFVIRSCHFTCTFDRTPLNHTNDLDIGYSLWFWY